MIKNIYRVVNLISRPSCIINGQKCVNYSSSVLPNALNRQKKFNPLISSARVASKREVSKKIQELLNLNPYKAGCIISTDDNFLKFPVQQLEKNYILCIEHGITQETIVSYPSILADSTLIIKLETIKLLPYDVNVTVSLLFIPLKKLKGFIHDEVGNSSRIEEYSKLFQVQISEVCKWISEKQFLTSINIDNVKESVQILLDSGVSLQAIINDLWVLRYSPGLIEERIRLAKENNIDIVKTWMVRAQREIFDNYVKRRSDNKQILGDKHDLAEYLSEKLECSPEVSKYLIAKQPALQKKRLKKMNEMIDFLLANGFKPIHICRTPKILMHSVETIRKRLKELEANNMKLDSLHVLTKSQRQYMSVFDSLISNKNKLKS